MATSPHTIFSNNVGTLRPHAICEYCKEQLGDYAHVVCAILAKRERKTVGKDAPDEPIVLKLKEEDHAAFLVVRAARMKGLSAALSANTVVAMDSRNHGRCMTSAHRRNGQTYYA